MLGRRPLPPRIAKTKHVPQAVVRGGDQGPLSSPSRPPPAFLLLSGPTFPPPLPPLGLALVDLPPPALIRA